MPRTTLDLEKVTEAAQRMDGAGFCLACGAEHDGIEPDAEQYECEACGKPRVFGAEQILVRFAF